MSEMPVTPASMLTKVLEELVRLEQVFQRSGWPHEYERNGGHHKSWCKACRELEKIQGVLNYVYRVI